MRGQDVAAQTYMYAFGLFNAVTGEIVSAFPLVQTHRGVAQSERQVVDKITGFDVHCLGLKSTSTMHEPMDFPGFSWPQFPPSHL